MLTLYGSKGSGSASTEAALEIAGLAYRARRRRVVEAVARPRGAQARQPDRADPDPGPRRRQRPDRERGDPDPPRPRPSRKRPARRASRRGARSRSAAWSTSPPTATPASASSTIPSAGIPIPTTPSRRRCRRAAGPACTSCGDLRRPVPGDAVAFGRAARRARHPRRDGVEVERRAQGAGRESRPEFWRLLARSTPPSRSPRCGRGTGPTID